MADSSVIGTAENFLPSSTFHLREEVSVSLFLGGYGRIRIKVSVVSRNYMYLTYGGSGTERTFESKIKYIKMRVFHTK